MLFSPARPFLATLFGSTVDADCVIRFTLAPEARPAKKTRREPSSPPRSQFHHPKWNGKVTLIKNEPTSHEAAAAAAAANTSTAQPDAGKTAPAAPKKAPRDREGHAPTERALGKGNNDVDNDDDVVLFLGDPIPAHRLILRCGSERFRAYMERWEPLNAAATPSSPISPATTPLLQRQRQQQSHSANNRNDDACVTPCAAGMIGGSASPVTTTAAEPETQPPPPQQQQPSDHGPCAGSPAASAAVATPAPTDKERPAPADVIDVAACVTPRANPQDPTWPRTAGDSGGVPLPGAAAETAAAGNGDANGHTQAAEADAAVLSVDGAPASGSAPEGEPQRPADGAGSGGGSGGNGEAQTAAEASPAATVAAAAFTTANVAVTPTEAASAAVVTSTPIAAASAAAANDDSEDGGFRYRLPEIPCAVGGEAAADTAGNTTRTAVKRSRARPAAAGGTCDTAAAIGGGGGLPEILIPLNSEEELPAATRALRYMYTGRVPHGIGFKELLTTRRLAGYLQIERCAEACDKAMVDKMEEEGAADSATVLDLFGCWHHFPDDTSFQRVVLAGCKHLVRHFGDALRIHNSPDPDREGSLMTQFTRLPYPAVAMLLGSDDFGTDSESSVLLLLGRWLSSNPFRPAGIRAMLCRLIRVLHLSPAYLAHVLPLLDWFDATPAQRAALAALAAARRVGGAADALLSSIRATGVDLGPDTEQDAAAAAATAGDGPICKWLAPARRQCMPPAHGCIYGWSASAAELTRAIRAAAAEPLIACSCHRCEASLTPKPAGEPRGPHGDAGGSAAAAAGGAPSLPVVIAHGLRWRLVLVVSRTEHPYVQISCRVPLLDHNLPGVQDLGGSCPVQVTMWTAAPLPPARAAAANLREKLLLDGRGGAAPFGVGVRLDITTRSGRRAEAANRGGAEPDPLAPWEPYMQLDGTLRGEVVFRLEPVPSCRFMLSEDEEEADDEFHELDQMEAIELEADVEEQIARQQRLRQHQQPRRRAARGGAEVEDDGGDGGAAGGALFLQQQQQREAARQRQAEWVRRMEAARMLEAQVQHQIQDMERARLQNRFW